MNRPWAVAAGFGLSLAVLLAALAWTSSTVLRLDEAEAAARRQAALEENVRLALWRVDSAVAPLVAQESARPASAYRSFNVDRTGGGELLAPSPLLGAPGAYTFVHFQFGPDARLSSPQLPIGDQRALALDGYTTRAALERARGRIEQLAGALDWPTLLARLPEPSIQPAPLVAMAPQPVKGGKASLAQQQSKRSAQEFQARSQYIATNAAQLPIVEHHAWQNGGGVMTPLWLDGRLLLARRLVVQGESYVQGCWLDWPRLAGWLTQSVEDLLPEARLLPAAAPGEEPARQMAALPVRLVPGSLPPAETQGLSALQWSLVVAWSCALLSAAAVAALVLGVVSLSERRAAFVSAVTHELRTPLTTFRMYAEMLAEGMVGDEQRRGAYLATLRAEAERLSHLVENVLSYARLERGRARARLQQFTAGSLVERLEPRLRARCAEAGMQLVVEAGEQARALAVRSDIGAIEQILFNLVDNACKYAASASDRRVHLEVCASGGCVAMVVRDHGPGIAAPQRRRLFRAFSKSAQEAASSAPGVGLGLALCRRLARELGGKLALDASMVEGASFVFTLPLEAQGRRP